MGGFFFPIFDRGLEIFMKICVFVSFIFQEVMRAVIMGEGAGR